MQNCGAEMHQFKILGPRMYEVEESRTGDLDCVWIALPNSIQENLLALNSISPLAIKRLLFPVYLHRSSS